MAAIKTVVSDASVTDFIQTVPEEGKRLDCRTLLALFERITGEPARMWGGSIIGFGSYHYKSERSKQEGDWPLTGFSPRKQNLTIYIMPGFGEFGDLLPQLGKYKTSVSCLYVKRLADIRLPVLEELAARSVAEMRRRYGQNP